MMFTRVNSKASVQSNSRSLDKGDVYTTLKHSSGLLVEKYTDIDEILSKVVVEKYTDIG